MRQSCLRNSLAPGVCQSCLRNRVHARLTGDVYASDVHRMALRPFGNLRVMEHPTLGSPGSQRWSWLAKSWLARTGAVPSGLPVIEPVCFRLGCLWGGLWVLFIVPLMHVRWSRTCRGCFRTFRNPLEPRPPPVVWVFFYTSVIVNSCSN